MKRACVIAISMICAGGCDKLGDLGDTGAVTSVGGEGGGDGADEGGADEGGADEGGADEGGADEGEAGEEEGGAGESSTSTTDASSSGADPTGDSEGGDPLLCDPLLQDCYEDELCVYHEDVFQCVPDNAGKSGHWGDPCDAFDVCQPGLFCAAAADVSSAEGVDACCAGFCDLSAPEDCADGSACNPFFVEGEAPPGLEDVGYCSLL